MKKAFLFLVFYIEDSTYELRFFTMRVHSTSLKKAHAKASSIVDDFGSNYRYPSILEADSFIAQLESASLDHPDYIVE